MTTIIRDDVRQAMEKGRLEATRHIALQLLKLHDSVTVSEITGLHLDEVKKLMSKSVVVAAKTNRQLPDLEEFRASLKVSGDSLRLSLLREREEHRFGMVS
jgi:hypothetical protein